MFRVLGLLLMVVALGALVASGVRHGWTPLHFEMAIPLGVLAVLAAMPTKDRASTR